MPKKIHIVALGSSFAAGPGIAPIEDEYAGRSSNNYAHQLCALMNSKAKWKATLTDLTVSGATTLNVLKESQQKESHTFQPQLDRLTEDADVVTFTCGGNDIGYIGGLITECLHPAIAKGNGIVDEKPSTPSIPSISYEALTSRVKKVIDAIHKKAPNARVYLVQYPCVIGDSTKPMSEELPLSAARKKHYESVAAGLANANYDAAKGRSWVTVIPVAERSRDHGLGSQRPWITTLDDAAPFHPDYEAHREISKMLYRQIEGQGE